jgi:hypothetical protein
MRRALLVLLVLPQFALAGDFVRDPSMALPGPKAQARPIITGPSANSFIQAPDFNALREALNDLRDQTTGWINARAFGVQCNWDGASGNDDTAALATALAWAYAQGKPLRLPSGRCRVTGPVPLVGDGSSGGVRVYAEMASRTYNNAVPEHCRHCTVIDSSGVSTWPQGRAQFEFVDIHGVHLYGIWFLGNGAGGRNSHNATTTGVRILGSGSPGDHRVDACNFQLHRVGLDMSAGQSTLPWDNATAFLVGADVRYGDYVYRALQQNTNVTPGTNGAVWAQQSFLGYSNGYSAVVDSVFTNNWKSGAIQWGGDSRWEGNYFNESWPVHTSLTDGAGAGLSLIKSRSVNVTGGKNEWNGKGIYLYNSGEVVISDVTWDKNTYAIFEDNSSSEATGPGRGITIIGNHFMSGGVSTIRLNSAAGTTISGLITGNTFAKGANDAYDWNDGTLTAAQPYGIPAGTADDENANTSGNFIGPTSNAISCPGAGTYVLAITGNNFENATSTTTNMLWLAGATASRYTLSGNGGIYTLGIGNVGTSSAPAVDWQDGHVKVTFDGSQGQGTGRVWTKGAAVSAMNKGSPNTGIGWELYFTHEMPSTGYHVTYSGNLVGYARITNRATNWVQFDLVGPDGTTGIAPTTAAISVEW